jgi:hypothetical protein
VNPRFHKTTPHVSPARLRNVLFIMRLLAGTCKPLVLLAVIICESYRLWVLPLLGPSAQEEQSWQILCRILVVALCYLLAVNYVAGWLLPGKIRRTATVNRSAQRSNTPDRGNASRNRAARWKSGN